MKKRNRKDWKIFQKWANSKYPTVHLRRFAKRRIKRFPELARMIDAPQRMENHPEGDVWKHTLFVVYRTRIACDELCIYGELRTILMIAALLHDIDKPSLTTVESDGKVKVGRGHGKVGAKMARVFLNKIYAPRHIINAVCTLVRLHMFHSLNETSVSWMLGKLDDVGLSIEDWLIIANADYNSSGGRHLNPGVNFSDTQQAILAIADSLETNAIEQLPLFSCVGSTP